MEFIPHITIIFNFKIKKLIKKMLYQFCVKYIPLFKYLESSNFKYLKVKKLSNNATIPSKGSEKAAGYDLFSAYDIIIPKYNKALIKTDIQIELPDGCYGRIAPRSGLSLKYNLDVGAGVIDADYRGNIGVILFNHSDTEYQVQKGDKIAQLICEKIYYSEIEEVDKLTETKRGINGFGSIEESIKKAEFNSNSKLIIQKLENIDFIDKKIEIAKCSEKKITPIEEKIESPEIEKNLDSESEKLIKKI